jgi:hypothetical protein
LGRCDGSGWIRVAETYVAKHAPRPTMILPDNPTDVEQFVYEAVWREWKLYAAGVANSSYPCPACAPGPFHRWSGGHWTSGHNRVDCDECWRADHPHSGRRRDRTRQEETPYEPVYTGSDNPEPSPPPRLFRADLD